jgi:hypothetical protein
LVLLAVLAVGCASVPTGRYEFRPGTGNAPEPELETARLVCTRDVGDNAGVPWYAGIYAYPLWRYKERERVKRYDACMRLQGWEFIADP